MSSNNKKQTKHSSAPVVSVGCSRLKSYLSLRRCHRPPQPQQCQQPPDSPPAVPPPELHHTPSDPLTAQAYWKRACELERELSRLSTWMNSYLSERLTSTRTTAGGDRESVHEAELTRLGDGSYLREVKEVGRPWGRLVMQISAPTIAQSCCTASEVMREMASMGDEELQECLAQSMPMRDMAAGCHPGSHEGTSVPPEDGFVEAVLLQTIERIEGLVMEGLKEQMGSSRRAAKGIMEKKEKERRGDCVVLVMQIRVRDPEEGYEAIAEPMVGFVEVSAAEVEGGRHHHIRRVVVAGIKDLSRLEKF